MRIFVAGIVTETNTFAPAPTGLGAFEALGIQHGDQGDDAKIVNGHLIQCLRDLAAKEGHQLALGLFAFAMPGGAVVRWVFESLRDELLGMLQAAMPVDAVILPLHGAMVADGYPDCEGDLISRVRAIVGRNVPIGVELDLHCHFTEAMRTQADVIVAYKEYPHTDEAERLREVWRLTIDTALGRIRPLTAVYDCRMIGTWHTTREPMLSFVQRMKDIEGRDGILSVSFGHGFEYGDVPDNGAKVWVISDAGADPGGAKAARLAEQLGREIWDMRDATRPIVHQLEAALDRLAAAPPGRPLVLADSADNAGGGAASDSTFILRRLVDRGIGNIAIGAFWDLGAIQICRDAGVGAALDLRLGGKCGPASGDPVDLRVTIRAIDPEHVQTALGQHMPCGLSVWLSTDKGLDIVLISIRQQAWGTDLFMGLGVDLASKRGIVVKSSQHFYAEFAPLAREVLYVDTPGLLRNDYENIPFRDRGLNFWPRVADPWRVTP